MSKQLNINLASLPSLVDAMREGKPLNLEGCLDGLCGPVKPFGGRASGEAKASKGLSIEGSTMQASGLMQILATLGVPMCRRWGEDPPGTMDPETGCPRGNDRRLCGAILPYYFSVSAGATSELYTVLAKKWFWPLFWVDNSNTNISVNEVTYLGDPVFENGAGSGPLLPSDLFAPTAFYGFVPGMPSISNTNGLVFDLANADGAAAQLFRGMLVGISIR